MFIPPGLLPPPTLSTLPPEILTRILGFLLSTNLIKDTRNEESKTWYLPNYGFSTSIMRVNKAFHAAAQQVFDSNHFILVSTTDNTLTTKLTSHRIWHRVRKIAPFKSFHLRLHITSSRFDATLERSRKKSFFVMCLDNLHDLAHILRLKEVATGASFKLIIELKRQVGGYTLSVKTQKALLAPLQKIQSIGQRCIIRGDVDDALAKHIAKLLQPQIRWKRGRCWEFYDLIRFKQSVAHSFFDYGNIGAALSSYLDILDLMAGGDTYFSESHFLGTAILDSDDEALRLRYQNSRAGIIANICLAFVETEEPLPPQLNHGMHLRLLHTITNIHIHDIHDVRPPSFLTASQFCVFKLLHGFALCALGRLEAGVASIRAANDVTNPHLHYIAELLKTAETLRSSFPASLFRNAIPYADPLFSVLLEKLRMGVAMGMFNMPEHTKRSPTFPAHSTVTAIDLERHVLRSCGFTGDLLEDRVLQKEGWSVELAFNTARASRPVATGLAVERPFDVAFVDETVIRIRERVAELQQANAKRKQGQKESVEWGIVKLRDRTEDSYERYELAIETAQPGVFGASREWADVDIFA